MRWFVVFLFFPVIAVITVVWLLGWTLTVIGERKETNT